MRINYFAVVVLSLLLASCASAPRESASQATGGHTEQGLASFYAMKYQFRRTASGERFNQMSRTAAHRTLPFGTRVRVTNLTNQQSVIVRINDRGPFVSGRIIDLSRSAFASIGDPGSGLITVRIEVVE